ncbi:MAG: T9SS type A sorting domain-containing protein [Candidatus Pacearchaeota archaeon]|nr:T9SS type A sorting domain-containing protein [Candidatus Pacearchaeota archaeon]
MVTAITFYVNPSIDSVPAVAGDSAKSYRIGLPGFTLGTPNENGRVYLPFHAGWMPYPQINDSIIGKVWNDKGYVTYQKVVLSEDVTKGLELHYDKPDSFMAFSANVRKLIDQTGLSGKIMVETHKLSNPAIKDTAFLDTALAGHYFHAFNVEKLNVHHGDSMLSVFSKGVSVIPIRWQVDTILGRAKLIADTLKFLGTGTNEGLENKVQKAGVLVAPNPTTGLVKFKEKAKGMLYDATGREILSFDAEQVDIRKYPNGIYFYIDEKKKQAGRIILIK